MDERFESKAPGTLGVPRTKVEARRFYDSISGYYDFLTSPFEREYAERACECLSVSEGETVLEIGCGTGHCLRQIAQDVGPSGEAYGIDLSAGMLRQSKQRLKKADLGDRTELLCVDAANLPFGSSVFDAVFMSFTLELFDTPEIPRVLEQMERVLKPGGRLAVVSMSRDSGRSMLLSLYEWAHGKWPTYVDCRPIYVERSIVAAGYSTRSIQKVRLFGLPLEIVVAVKLASENPP
jgi:ubiquinone/menaquinone biosynthesis C-methylase UbiE